jgi:hypothetical protein
MSEDGQRRPGSDSMVHRERPGGDRRGRTLAGRARRATVRTMRVTPRPDALIPALDEGQLTANQAGLVAVAEPTIEQGLDKALTKAAKAVKRTVEATTDEITGELQEALKG